MYLYIKRRTVTDQLTFDYIIMLTEKPLFSPLPYFILFYLFISTKIFVNFLDLKLPQCLLSVAFILLSFVLAILNFVIILVFSQT